MKLFGLNITRAQPTPQPPVVKDEVPEIKVVIPNTIKPSLIPRQKNPTLNYHSERAVGRGAFQSSEYDLAEIGRIEDTDSYVMQAFQKKIGLMFKEGWDLIGKNPRTIKYIRARFAQIARASEIPTHQLMRKIGEALVKKSNAFVVKVRKVSASGGRIRTEPGKIAPIEPVAAYFVAPAETMEFKLSSNRLQRWRQRMPDGETKEWNPKDVIHFYHNQKEGFIFGTPVTVPVADDIRALRKIEENIELLVYQHLFPMFHYKVGTPDQPAGVNENGEREVDVVRREIQFMPTEGGIVTPERHEITAIGAEGRALRAESYVEHFKKRVFSGLGVSAVDMGEGETANRATADNMSRNLVDAVKDLQQVMEIFVNEHIINELLLESTFGDSVLDEENLVYLKFKEIDVDAQIKRETHAADQFNKDIITHDEARRRMGYEPIIVPTSEEVEAGMDAAERFPEWNKTRWKLFKEPELLIQALKEPLSPVANAAANNNSTSVTSGDNSAAAQEQQKRELALETAKAKLKPSTPRSTKDGFLENTFIEIKKDIVGRVSQDQTLDHDWIATLIRTQMSTTINQLISDQVLAFRNGYGSVTSTQTQTFTHHLGVTRNQLRDRAEQYINRLTENVISSLRRNITQNTDDITNVTRAVFETVQFRTRFIEDVEVRKAYYLGQAYGNLANGSVTMKTLVHSDNACTTCNDKANTDINLGLITLDDVPPHHAGCGCTIGQPIGQVVEVADSVIKDGTPGSADHPDNLPEGVTAECPDCGKTAIKANAPNSYKCKACNNVFSVVTDNDIEEQEDALKTTLRPKSQAYKFTKCKQKAKSRLRVRHPDWTEDQIESASEAACIHLLDMIEEDIDETIEDATLEECVLSVKKSLRKQHPDWSADKIKSSAFAICNSRIKGK